MKKNTIIKLSIAAGIGIFAGKVAYKLVKDRKEKKFINSIEDEYLDEQEHEDIVKNRHYTKIR